MTERVDESLLPSCFFIQNQDCPKSCDGHRLSSFNFALEVESSRLSAEEMKYMNQNFPDILVNAMLQLTMAEGIEFSVSPRNCKKMNYWLDLAFMKDA